MKKPIAILGATGSIGVNALEVVRQHPDKFRVVGLSAHRNVSLLAKQVEAFRPEVVAVTDPAAYEEAVRRVGCQIKVLPGKDGAVAVATHPEVSLVVSAMVGAAGLTPTLAAIRAGKDVALANKETLVIGGELIISAVAEAKIRLIPIDSEHSAIFQSLLGHSKNEIRRIILTASGGPFRQWPLEKMRRVTSRDALRHPNWDMGAKVTIDSATMMNKGLEVIEARWLFDMPPDQIEVLIHPESIIHSMVEYLDGVVMAQLGVPDMRIPIAYALGYPERMDMGLAPLDLAKIGQLTFEAPDTKRFPALALAYEALRRGKTVPSVMNAANEIAVSAFLEGRLSFLKIPDVVSYAMERHQPLEVSLDTILEADREGRQLAHDYIETHLKGVS